MNINNFIESLGENKEELLKKGAMCTSVDELLALAVEYGLTLDGAGATELLEAKQVTIGKLTDEELDSVAGGGFRTKVRENAYYREYFTCKNCGSHYLRLPDPTCADCGAKAGPVTR